MTDHAEALAKALDGPLTGIDKLRMFEHDPATFPFDSHDALDALCEIDALTKERDALNGYCDKLNDDADEWCEKFIAARDDRDRLAADLAREEKSHEQTLAERDNHHEWADKLAHAIGGPDVGNHSNINNPWANALEIAETTAADLAEARKADPVAWQIKDKHGNWITLPGDWQERENIPGREYRALYAARAFIDGKGGE